MAQVKALNWNLYLAKIKKSRRARDILYAHFFAPDNKAALEYARTKYFPGDLAYIIDCRKATEQEKYIIESGDKVDW